MLASGSSSRTISPLLIHQSLPSNHDVDRMQLTFISVVTVAGTLLLSILYILLPSKSSYKYLHDDHLHHVDTSFSGLRVDPQIVQPITNPVGQSSQSINCSPRPLYNSSYPLSIPQIIGLDEIRFRMAIISDLDLKSKQKVNDTTWSSFMLQGTLIQYKKHTPSIKTSSGPGDYRYAISWDRKLIEFKSPIGSNGRGMELSDLVVFNGSLYTCDDHTGIVYEIKNQKVIPRYILSDGDGNQGSDSAFKCEWMAVKDQKLIIGGLGKEWTNKTGHVINFNNQFVKIIDSSGFVSHENWRQKFLSILSSVGITFPGYIIHESAAWSQVHKKWYFLPRRVSATSYKEKEDEMKGSNLLIVASEDFQDVKVSTIGPVIPSHGFSSFKFIPGTNDEHVIALKTTEIADQMTTFVTIFDLKGNILLPETKITENKLINGKKFEGIEFI